MYSMLSWTTNYVFEMSWWCNDIIQRFIAQWANSNMLLWVFVEDMVKYQFKVSIFGNQFHILPIDFHMDNSTSSDV